MSLAFVRHRHSFEFAWWSPTWYRKLRETRAPSWYVEGYSLLWLLSIDGHIALSKTVRNNYRPDINVYDYRFSLKCYSNSSQLYVINTNTTYFFGVTVEISTPGKNADWNYTKCLSSIKALSEGRERSFTYCSMAPIETDIDFHQLWCETFTLVGWLHSIGGQCMSMSSSENNSVYLLCCHPRVTS